MTHNSSGECAQRITRRVNAPRATVYAAFLDADAVAAWMSPDNMRLHIHHFEPREGGLFRISLTYENADDAQYGKTSFGTDTYHGRFAELVPDEKIVETIEFETSDPAFAGEMTMTVLLADAEGGTEVAMLYDNLPSGIRPEDNAVGTRASLQKLAALVE